MFCNQGQAIQRFSTNTWFALCILMCLGFAASAPLSSSQNTPAAQPAPHSGAGDPNQVRQVSDYDWSQNPSGSIAAGSNTLTLTPCPRGMNLAHYNAPNKGLPAFSVYLPDHGTAEAAPITGGSCTSGAVSGALIITAAYPHSVGFAVQSASSGLQEMMNDSCDAPGPEAGKAIQIRGMVAIYAESFVPCSNLTVDFTGAVMKSYVNGAATLFVGFPGHSAAVYNTTLINPRGQAEVTGNQHPFIDVNRREPEYSTS